MATGFIFENDVRHRPALAPTLSTLLMALAILTARSWTRSTASDAAANFFGLLSCLAVFSAGLLYSGLHWKYVQRRRPSLVDGTLPNLAVKVLSLPLMFHAVAVLLGAPFFEDWDGTLAFGLLLAGLVLPSVAASSVPADFTDWKWLASMPAATLAGAWLGAVVIPLDWDRPWQIWPEPCCLGATGAAAVDALLRLFRTAATLRKVV